MTNVAACVAVVLIVAERILIVVVLIVVIVVVVRRSGFASIGIVVMEVVLVISDSFNALIGEWNADCPSHAVRACELIGADNDKIGSSSPLHRLTKYLDLPEVSVEWDIGLS